MREIKFRAWDAKFGVMLPNVVAYGNDSIILTDVAFNEAYTDRIDERYDSGVEQAGFEHECITGNLMIMQLTGLKDIEGKVIYEDDVCEVQVNVHGKPSGNGFKAGIKYNEHIGAFQIKYRCMAGGFCTDSIGSYFLKVIGNIHQNPDLLV